MSCGHDPRFCACCEGPAGHTPAPILNRPGLAALAYRVGVFATFRQAMTDAISRDRRLDGFTVREADDMAISIIESFAAIGDVLTFYNERLVNELYLRTALERDSVRRLIYLTGYRMRPGLAATADLAFRLEDEAAMTLRRGLKTMSVPGPEEAPVFFETLDDIDACAALNERPLFGLPFPFNGFARGAGEGPVARRPDRLSIGDRLVFWGLDLVEEKSVEGLPEARGGPRMAFAPPVQATGLWPAVARAAKIERRLGPLGRDAPDAYQQYVANDTIPPADRWQSFSIDHGQDEGAALPLDRTYDDLSPGDHLLIDAGAGIRLRTVVIGSIESASETIGGPGAPVPFRTETVSRVELLETIRGTPGSAGPFHAVRTGTGRLARLDRDMGETRWTPLSRFASSDPAVTEQAGVRHVFCRGEDRILVHHSVQADGTSATATLGGDLAGRPAAIAAAGGELRVFAQHPDGGIRTRAILPAPGPWQDLGGEATSPPTVVERAPGELHLFVRGADRGLWRTVRSGGVWGDFERLRGTLATAPSAAAVAGAVGGAVDVAALDDEGRIVQRRETSSGWRPWQTGRGRFVDPPALVAGPNRLDVFATAHDGVLWHRIRLGDTWQPWLSLDGTLASGPAASRDGNRLFVVGRGTDGVTWERAALAADWGPWRRLGRGMPAVADRRRMRIWQISAEDLVFRDHDYPPEAAGSALALPLRPADPLPQLLRLLKNRRAIVAEGRRTHATDVTEAVAFSVNPGALADHLRLGLADPLAHLSAAPVLLANVARASHGETQRPEPLVGPTGPLALRRVRLKGAPLTYIADPAALEGRPELDIRVGGVRWHPVASLYGQGRKARVFTLRETTEGETEIAFGDGTHGAIPSGTPHAIQAIYRVGTGLAGRVRPGQLSVLLEKPPGLASVTNPAAASGAADPEPRGRAAENAPAQLRSFGRIVSLADFVAVAQATGLVAKAHVTWVWQAFERAAHLSVAGPGGAALSADELSLLHQMLDSARLPFRRLSIAGLTMIPVVIEARVVAAPDTSRDAAAASARAALADLLAFDRCGVGEPLHASAVYAALHDAAGVAAADVDVFHVKGYRDLGAADLAKRYLTADDLQPQVTIFPARPLPPNPGDIDPLAAAAFDGPPPPVLPAEQASIESPAEDIRIFVTEML